MRSQGKLAHSVQSSPILTGAAAVTLIAGGCTSIANALVLIALCAAVLPLTAALAALERGRLNVVLRPMLFALVSVLAVFGVSLLIDNVIAYDSVAALGIYAPLLAFDSIAVAAAEYKPSLTPGKAAAEAFTGLFAVAACALPVALIREVLGSGKLLGLSLGFSGANALLMPFAGFILCAFAIAVLKALFCRKETDA